MKTKLIALIFIGVLYGCAKPVQIGHVNMISNRNISTGTEYEVLQKFSNSSTRQLKKSRSRTLNDAIDNVVKSVPGGEYLMNAKLYKLGRYFAAEGDVWGISDQSDINGLKPNSTAFYKRRGGTETVKILSFVDKNRINIQLENGKVIAVDRERLVPTINNQ